MEQNLETYCREKGITYSDLAARSGLTPSYISLIANGKRTKLSYPVKLRLAKALELTMPEFSSVLFSSAASSNLTSPMDSKSNSAYTVPRNALELFFALLDNALHALHSNNLPEFKHISANICAEIPDTIPLKSKYVSWYAALTLAWNNQFAPALIQLEKAAQFKASSPLQKSFKAKIIGDIGSVHVALGNYKEALRMFKRSISVCNQGEQAAVVYLNMGSLHLRMREFQRSLEAFERALSLDSPQFKLLVYSGLGQLAMDQHKFPIARKYLLTGYCLARSLTDDLHKGDIFCNLGKYYKELMKYTLALRILNRGLAHTQNCGMKRTKLYILVEISDVYLMQSNFQGFDEIVSQIHSEISTEGDYKLFGALLLVVAEEHYHAHRYSQALLPLETSYRFLVDKDASKELLTSCLLLEKVYVHEKRLQEVSFIGKEIKRIKKLLAI